MKLITEQEITVAFQKFNQMSDTEIDTHIEHFTEEQPILFAYIMTVDDEFDENERQALLMVAIQVWFILNESDLKLTSVDREFLEKIDLTNDKLLDDLAEEEDDETSGIEKLVVRHQQPQILDVIIACLQDEEIAEPPLKAESVTFMFMYLLNFLDSLLESAEK